MEGKKAKFWGGVPTLMDTPLAMAFEAAFAIVIYETGTEIGDGIHCVEDVSDDDDCAREVKRVSATKAIL